MRCNKLHCPHTLNHAVVSWSVVMGQSYVKTSIAMVHHWQKPKCVYQLNKNNVQWYSMDLQQSLVVNTEQFHLYHSHHSHHSPVLYSFTPSIKNLQIPSHLSMVHRAAEYPLSAQKFRDLKCFSRTKISSMKYKIYDKTQCNTLFKLQKGAHKYHKDKQDLNSQLILDSWPKIYTHKT